MCRNKDNHEKASRRGEPMGEETSTTKWRNKPIVPEGYDDPPTLLPVARKARSSIVEFDWVFSGEELRSLRRAVYEWGCGVVGRYKCFDARVLAAINEALGDERTVFVLREPQNGQWIDAKVVCVSEGEKYRLRGHAPFDLVFGYAAISVNRHRHEYAYLGAPALDMLGSAVRSLGWDIERLHEERFRPVRNVLYGLRPEHGSPSQPPAGPPVDLPIHLHGPFSASDEPEERCLFSDEIASKNGVYLWTLRVAQHERPWYVGQTRRTFAERLGEHIRGMLAGQYRPYDAEALARGEYAWAKSSCDKLWPQALSSFLRNYESLAPEIIAVIRMSRFRLIPLTGDAHLYNRVEGALGRHFRSHDDAGLREFFTPGIKLPPPFPGDQPLRLLITSDVPVVGLPAQLLT
jgi:hypothetical protein